MLRFLQFQEVDLEEGCSGQLDGVVAVEYILRIADWIDDSFLLLENLFVLFPVIFYYYMECMSYCIGVDIFQYRVVALPEFDIGIDGRWFIRSSFIYFPIHNLSFVWRSPFGYLFVLQSEFVDFYSYYYIYVCSLLFRRSHIFVSIFFSEKQCKSLTLATN